MNAPDAVPGGPQVRPTAPGRAPGDRRDDRHLAVRGLEKPPVLSRRSLRGLCLLSLAVILYGTLGPLRSEPGPWLAPVRSWQWVPPLVPSGLNDILTNVAVYIPVGISFRLLVRRRGRAGGQDWAIGLGLSLALSYITEVLQQAMPGRVASLTDVAVNGLAALVGCWWAVPVQRVIRRLHASVFIQMRSRPRRWTMAAWASLLATAILMTMPWNLGRGRVELGLERLPGRADIQRLGMFALVGFFLAGARLTRGPTRRRALTKACLIGGFGAVGLELAQLALGGHVCSLRHALISLAGVSAGCLSAALVVRCAAGGRAGHVRRRHWAALDTRKVALAGLLAAILYAGVAAVGHARTAPGLRAEPAVDWVPFHAQFHAPLTAVVADVIERLALYAFLTLTCLIVETERGGAAALLLLFGVVTATECVRAFLLGCSASTTGAVLAIAAWGLTRRVWNAVRPTAQSLPPVHA
jgi:VanZ family protein